MSRLPSGWKKPKLGDIGSFKNGINKSKEDFGSGHPFVNLLDIFGKSSLTNPELALVNVDAKELEIYDLKEGDVLFVRSSVKPEGVGLTSVLMNDLPSTVYSGFIIRFRLNDKVTLDKDYCKYCFHSDLFRKEVLKRSSISANTNVNQQSLSKTHLIIPPLSQQRMIAGMLGAWDVAIEETEALIAAKEQQFEWLRSNTIKDAASARMQEMGDFLRESRITDISNNPQKRLTVRLHLKGVDIREYRGTESQEATTYFLRKAGQLIYGKQNIFRGSIGIVPYELDGYASSQDIPAFDIADNIHPDWLFWYMSRPCFYERLEHLATGSGSKRLHPKELFKVHIPVPTLGRQKRIAKVLNTAYHEIDLLKKLAEQYRTQKRGLMQKLLTGAWKIEETANG